jgi:hypothetical protein
MSDFTMLDPRSQWEYDLHSVRHDHFLAIQGADSRRTGVFRLHSRILSIAQHPLVIYPNSPCIVDVLNNLSGEIDHGGTRLRRLKNSLPFHGQSSPSPMPGQGGPYRYSAEFHQCFCKDDQNEVRYISHFLIVLRLTRRLREKIRRNLQALNILQVTPFETANRHLRHVSDYATMHSSIPAAILAAFKTRISWRTQSDPGAVGEEG